MREILFRGKRLDNGEWVEGFFVNLWMVHRKAYDPLITDAHTGHSYDVDPDTVGQYTGLKDQNGKRIFEGDVVAYRGRMEAVKYYGGGFSPFAIPGWECTPESFEVETVGNIYDTPGWR